MTSAFRQEDGKSYSAAPKTELENIEALTVQTFLEVPWAWLWFLSKMHANFSSVVLQDVCQH